MQRFQPYIRYLTITAFCLLNIHLGLYVHSPWLIAGGTVGICYVLLKTATASRVRFCRGRIKTLSGFSSGTPQASDHLTSSDDADCLVQQMLAQSRYALLLRPQIAETLTSDQLDRALNALRETASLVPEGPVVLREGGSAVHVGSFFLDRFPVTNRLYYEFVTGGGYTEMALWDPGIRQALADLVDQTGQPGPSEWKDGRFAPGTGDQPVVGINWYEAAACARWLGKRLPSDTEWVKAACWPVAVAPQEIVQRRFPWGDSVDIERANLLGNGSGEIVAVDQFAAGVSVGGAYQLIGNVWEWTSGTFSRDQGKGSLTGTTLKSIRGGAFDTHPSQQTNDFHDGADPLLRRQNIGFRCAIGACDLALPHAETPCSETTGREAEAVPENALEHACT